MQYSTYIVPPRWSANDEARPMDVKYYWSMARPVSTFKMSQEVARLFIIYSYESNKLINGVYVCTD